MSSKGQILDILKEELSHNDALKAFNFEDDPFEKDVLATDHLKVQQYIELKIREENRNIFFDGKERTQQEIFPSLQSVAEKPSKQSRNVIREANEVKHKLSDHRKNQPLNQYFYQPSQVSVIDTAKAWQAFVATDHPQYSVRS